MHLFPFSLIQFLVCFLPGVLCGFALFALIFNRRLHNQTRNTPRPLIRL
jgi:hypothetical protein